ncbi:MAG: RHS repeat-associated core domain-containing protein [Thermoanaerobaculia bacterium]
MLLQTWPQLFPLGLKRAIVSIVVAGRAFRREFSGIPEQTLQWEWDGRDAWGRVVRGRQRVTVARTFIYDAAYARPRGGGLSFGELSATATPIGSARGEFETIQTWTGMLGAATVAPTALGSWTLSGQHHYDTSSRELNIGIGTRAGGLEAKVVRRSQSLFFSQSRNAEVAPDGSLIVTTQGEVWRLAVDGTRTHLAGNPYSLESGEGIPATNAVLRDVSDLAISSTGAIYVAERYGFRVRRIDPDGRIWTVAGTGEEAAERRDGEGGPARAARLKQTLSLALGPDGSLYLGMDHVLRKVSPSGIITTIIGGSAGSLADGIPASGGHTSAVWGIAVAGDGTIYYSDTLRHLIRAIGPDGIVRTIAGNGQSLSKLAATSALTGDVDPLAASLDNPMGVAIAADGSVYFGDRNCFWPSCNPSGPFGSISMIRRITPEGTLAFVSGPARNSGGWDIKPTDGIQYKAVQGLAFAPSGALFIVSPYNSSISKLDSAFPGFDSGSITLPDSSGSLVYVFDGDGRHLATRDALFGSTRAEFRYDSAGRLTAIVDESGRATTIDRAGDLPTAIISPGGKQTQLGWDANGMLQTITAPGGRITSFTYTADGLMRTMTDPRGGVARFDYDANGRLIRDTDAAGGAKSLTLSEFEGGFEVTLTDALDRPTRYQVGESFDGRDYHATMSPSGLSTQVLRAPSETTVDSPDGTRLRLTNAPDPLFGMMAPQQSAEITTPLGNRWSHWFARSYEGEVGSITKVFDQVLINPFGYWTSELVMSTRTRTTRSGADRTTREVFDDRARLTELQVAGITPTTFAWTSRGKLGSVSQGGRTYTFEWSAADELVSVTDPLGRNVGFTYDSAGRVVQQTLSDGRVIGFAYDLNDNLIALTPPGRPAHGFDYSTVDLETAYRPPAVAGSGTTATRYEYNLARDLMKVIRPDGAEIGLGYDAGGRLASLSTPRGAYRYAYDSGGNLESLVAPEGMTLEYGWDGFLPTHVRWSGAVSGEVSWVYDEFRVAIERVNGVSISFGYELDLLLARAGDMTIQRDPANGRITGTTLRRLVDAYGYDADGRLSSYVMRDAGTEALRLEYARDAVGRIVEKRESRYGVTLVERYEYDVAGRLWNVYRNGVLEATYAYNANGNRLSKTTPSGVETGTYDDQDRMLSYANATYTYTANGELRTKTDASGTTTYDYDVLGNLWRVDLPDGTVIEYVIDGQNRRVGKKVNGVLERGWLYSDQLNPIAELDGAGNVVSRFVYGTRANVPNFMIRGAVTYRVVSDHLGSVKYVIDVATGAIAQAIVYDEFGRILQDTNPGLQPFAFAGGVFDREIELVRFGARDYEPAMGRWTAKDPSLFAGGDTNLYGYTFNDPVNFIDREGRQAQSATSVAAQTAVELGMALGTMISNWAEMVWVNTVGVDPYYHCMANCQASRIGFMGPPVAQAVSDVREMTDVWRKGATPQECAADQFANRTGRNAPRSQPCESACRGFLPPGFTPPTWP